MELPVGAFELVAVGGNEPVQHVREVHLLRAAAHPDTRPFVTPIIGIEGRLLGGLGCIWKERKRTGTFGVA